MGHSMLEGQCDRGKVNNRKRGTISLQRYPGTSFGKTLWNVPGVSVESGTYSKYKGNTWEVFVRGVI